MGAAGGEAILVKSTFHEASDYATGATSNVASNYQNNLRFSEMPKASTISKVQFHFLQRNFSLADRTSLKVFIETIFRKEGCRLQSLNYIFCSDTYLLSVNRQFLKHDFYTDILTFDLSDRGHPKNAEIYISVDRVRDNASNYDSSFKKELHRVIFHGALHLCGYKDKSPAEAKMIRKMEDKYMDLYFGV